MTSLNNIHPGEVLREEFMYPLEISQNELARNIEVTPRRINEIVLEKRSITPDTSLRLAKFFGTTPDFWLNLQIAYDLEEKQKELKPVLKHIKPFKFEDPEHYYST